ncbi:MAG: hypothetical protein GKS03_04305 [Alphaproteobacteria bacterium]|nr:hypothetical protein [Alphaproteobacteria bacterium]
MRKVFVLIVLLAASTTAAIFAIGSGQPKDAASSAAFENCTLPQIEIASLKNIDATDTSLIIGHAYGNPRNAQQGKVDRSLTDFLQAHSIQFGDIYFTGDILPSPRLEWFADLKQEMSGYGGNIYAVPGNHDTGFSPNADHSIFMQSFGMTYPALMSKDGANFLLIDTIEHPWAITPDAIELAKNKAGTTDTLIILAHSIMRPSPTEIANSLDGIPDPLPDNLALIARLKTAYEKIFVISGDTGAFGNRPAIECRVYQNVTFISQGLGVDDGLILAIRDSKFFTLPLNQ